MAVVSLFSERTQSLNFEVSVFMNSMSKDLMLCRDSISFLLSAEMPLSSIWNRKLSSGAEDLSMERIAVPENGT